MKDQSILNILNYKLKKLLGDEKYNTINDEDRKLY